MRTDIHTHIFHPRVAAKAVERLKKLGFEPEGSGLAGDLLLRAERAGLDRVVAHNVATAPAQMIPVNTFAIALQAEHPKITAFGSVHPAAPGWKKELDRLEKNGIRGLKWHPNFQNLALDDPALFPVMEAAQDRFLLLCHLGCEEPLEQNPASPHKLRTLIGKFPKARFIAAHMGGYCNAAAARDALAGEDLWLDCSNTAHFSDQELGMLFDAHPRERILFGSDYPLFDPLESWRLLQRRLGFSDREMDGLARNASALI
jgi:predicted TIM-barrel fold metal-dependent hydrolase